MPKAQTRKKDKTRSLYIHNLTTISSQSSTALKSGQVRTLTTRRPNEETSSSMVEDVMGREPSNEDLDIGPEQSLDTSPEVVSGITVRIPAKRYKNSDNPLLTWIQYRDDYLDSFLELEGRGRLHSFCSVCGSSDPMFRCLDCHGRRMECKACLIERHQLLPLHVVQVWQGSRFLTVSLKSLDLSVHLGHGGKPCGLKRAAHKDLLVFDTNGIHSVNVFYCGCRADYTNYQQMLDVAWFPATPLEPQTCATFTVMRQFHSLNLQGKTTGYDYYKTLVALTDGTGLTNINDRMAPFMLMIREWRHLKMAKRSGRGHDSGGIKATPRGGLALDCRACPHPTINLPPNWEQAPAEESWLYRLILSQDANFRLKNRLRSSEKKDPSLGPGWAYFVDSDEYLKHLANYVDQDEISHCVGFAALWLANSKKSKGLRATGVGSVSCARHQYFRPNGTGDLQKGERYANMDFILFATLTHSVLLWLMVVYDIACQYCKGFWQRHSALPESLRFVRIPTVDFKVPKFHLPPHKIECHGPFSLGYTPGVGRTDGEGVERNWAWLNGAAPSTSQMGPGSRHDTLDDFMGFSNYKKTIDLGSSLLKALIGAIPEAILHRQAFEVFTESLSNKEHQDDLRKWEKMVKDFEVDPKKPDPYIVKEDTVSVNEIRRQLLQEEHQQVRLSGTSSDTTPASFILSGLDIEESQYVAKLEAHNAHSPTQQVTLQGKRTNILKKITKFRDAQRQLMPGLPLPDDDSDTVAEQINIRLPSALDACDRSSCVPGLTELEDRLREAQASESLSDLRRQLRIRTFTNKFRDQNASSQRAYTRMRTLSNQVETRIRAARDRYNAARAAMLSLRGPGEWEHTYRLLNQNDIVALNERTLTRQEQEARELAQGLTRDNADTADDEPAIVSTLHLQTGDGRRQMSWIWYNITSDEIVKDADGSLRDGLRLEWLKARARAGRWQEEVILVDEEMRRVLEYCRWQAEWWDFQADAKTRTGISSSLREGLKAYATEQGDIERHRHQMWETRWAAVRVRAKEVVADQLTPFRPIQVDLDILEQEELDNEWSDDD